jgi:hypothetical protein
MSSTKVSDFESEVASRCPFTRTKLALQRLLGLKPRMENAGGRCPLGFDRDNFQPGSAFINQAAHDAAVAPVMPGDPEAEAFLAEARRHIYHWPADFKGFSCKLTVADNSKVYHGTLVSRGSRDYELKVNDFEPRGWLRFQVEEFLSHREHPDVSRMASKTGVIWGDEDAVYGKRIDFVGDTMKSFYRIKDNKLTMIGRTYAQQTFVITIDDHAEFFGHYAATRYTTFYRNAKTGALEKTEAYLDDYQQFGEVLLPTRRRYTECNQHGLLVRELTFTNHQLLN